LFIAIKRILATDTMTSETSVATLAFLGIVCLNVGLAQPPVPAEKASISGVVSGTDGKLLRRATVHLASRDLSVRASRPRPHFRIATRKQTRKEILHLTTLRQAAISSTQSAPVT
jgi:hypothetical protein